MIAGFVVGDDHARGGIAAMVDRRAVVGVAPVIACRDRHAWAMIARVAHAGMGEIATRGHQQRGRDQSECEGVLEVGHGILLILCGSSLPHSMGANGKETTPISIKSKIYFKSRFE